MVDRVAPLEQGALVPTVLVDAGIVIVFILLREVAINSSTGRRVRCLRLAIHEVLSKDTQVEEKGDETASQPAQIYKDVFAVDVTSLAGFAFGVLALGIVSKDGQNVCNVSKACKEEEEHAKSISRLAPPVQDELG